jgi:hypothetical protein
MRIEELESLDEAELGMCLYIVNVVKPIREFHLSPRALTFVKHQMLVQRLLGCLNNILPEHRPIFLSLMKKMGIVVEIKDEKKEIVTPSSGSNS